MPMNDPRSGELWRNGPFTYRIYREEGGRFRALMDGIVLGIMTRNEVLNNLVYAGNDPDQDFTLPLQVTRDVEERLMEQLSNLMARIEPMRIYRRLLQYPGLGVTCSPAIAREVQNLASQYNTPLGARVVADGVFSVSYHQHDLSLAVPSPQELGQWNQAPGVQPIAPQVAATNREQNAIAHMVRQMRDTEDASILASIERESLGLPYISTHRQVSDIHVGVDLAVEPAQPVLMTQYHPNPAVARFQRMVLGNPAFQRLFELVYHQHVIDYFRNIEPSALESHLSIVVGAMLDRWHGTDEEAEALVRSTMSDEEYLNLMRRFEESSPSARLRTVARDVNAMIGVPEDLRYDMQAFLDTNRDNSRASRNAFTEILGAAAGEPGVLTLPMAPPAGTEETEEMGIRLAVMGNRVSDARQTLVDFPRTKPVSDISIRKPEEPPSFWDRLNQDENK